MAVMRSQCGQCSVGCGIRAIVRDDRALLIEGDRVHPANGGRLCTRGQALSQTALDGRLLHPLVGGRRVGWNRAIAHAARKFATIMARHGPGSVALHVSGGLLTEDYYVANKLMKGFFGSAHIHAQGAGLADLAAIQRVAFGEDVMPAAIEDIERAQTILLVGARTGRDHPVLLERVQAAREAQGIRLILLTEGEDGGEIDVDLRLSVNPGAMARLLTGALLHCRTVEGGDLSGAVPVSTWTAMADGHDLWSIARLSGLSPATIRAFYEEVAATDRLVTLAGDHAGPQAVAAVCNLHMATGRIGRPGSTPFLLAGSANGMGAREVGCMADHLAAHRFFTPDACADIARFWGARRLVDGPGLGGDALLEAMREGRIKALWSIGPEEAAIPWLRAARAAVPFAMCSSAWMQGVEDFDMLLPAPVWIEKDGTLTASDRLVSRQRRLLPLPGEARPDWWILTKVAQALGWGDAFHYERPADIYREHVRLTAYRNAGDRLLNLKRHAPISNPAYDELTPWRWGDLPFDGGRFPTIDGKPRLLWPLDQDFAAIA